MFHLLRCRYDRFKNTEKTDENQKNVDDKVSPVKVKQEPEEKAAEKAAAKVTIVVD